MPGSKIILYIEDNRDNRILVRRILNSAGYALIEAENAWQAIDCLYQNKPDLVLMDIQLPGVDGYTFTTKLKSLPGLRNMPIVALTSYGMPGDHEKSLLAGCDGHIDKPIDVDDFLEQISYYINAHWNRHFY